MIRKLNGSLFVKVFTVTASMLLCVSLLVYGLLAWLMPQTYSSRLNAVLDERSRDFIAELEQVAFSDSGGLFDRFLQDQEIYAVELYDGNGRPVSLPSWQNLYAEESSVMQAVTEGPYESSPVLSNQYYFSFSGSEARYMLVVYGTAEQVTQLRQSFLRILPMLFLAVFMVTLGASWLYSRMITKPVLEISRVAEEMSGLHLDWQLEERRTDELGALEKSLNTLARNLSAALSDLQNANQKLEEDIRRERKLEQARTDFFSAVSHELKTPVTVIKGQLEGMLLNIGAYKDRDRYLARSLEIACTLETMVQEILTISRLEAAGGELKKEPFDCVEAVKRYLRETEDLIAQKELWIRLELPQTAFVQGNRMLMEKVFSNLIGNAIQYSPPEASIRISGHMERGEFCFSVENSGTHIPEESIPKLFDAFYRVEQSRSRKTGGSGLGLYVTQRILREHDSECAVRNTPDGVRFSFAVQAMNP